MPRPRPVPPPPLRLGAANHELDGHLRHALGHALHHPPHHRPPRQGRHPLLQPGRRRRPPPLPAPVLVLRPPRGLHHLRPRHRLRLRHHPHLHPPPHVRLRPTRPLDGRHRVHRL